MLRAALFADTRIADKICRSFGLTAGMSGEALEAAMQACLGQAERDPVSHHADASEVFRAAVRAIGSNSRRWVSYCVIERKLAPELGGFDPSFVRRRDRNHVIGLIRQMLPGLTSKRDAESIVRWAEQLAGPGDEYQRLLDIRQAAVIAGSRLPSPPDQAELTAIVAAAIGMGSAVIGQHGVPDRKAPGMGPVLASEFLRNLGWSGFKPDRHVQRLLSCWFGDDEPSRSRGAELAGLLQPSGLQLANFMTFSVLGSTRCPPGESVNRVDQLIWLYGAFVNKKSRKRRPQAGDAAPRQPD